MYLERRLLPLMFCSLVASCDSMPRLYSSAQPETAEQAANVFVSAYPSVPWRDIKDKLEPGHNLTIDAAKLLAITSTQSQISQFLSTFAVGLGIGLPNRSGSTTTTIGADGKETTSGTRTYGSGTPPTSSGVTSTTIADTALAPDFAKALTGAGIDANTLLEASTGLFHQARILDNQISKQYEPMGYSAQLITFQINLQPVRRDVAFDAYVNISLFPASFSKAVANGASVAEDAGALSPIIVYPLVITDALESSTTGRSIEVMRQAALGVAGIVGSTGLSFGLSNGSNQLDSVVGSEKSSLVTVGRVSDHTVRVRLGAPNSPSSRYALIPRTYNLSLVVFVKRGSAERYKEGVISAITETSLYPVNGGDPLASSRLKWAPELAKQVSGKLKQYGFTLSHPEQCAAGAIADPGVTAEQLALLDLLRAVDRADYVRVFKCLDMPDGKIPTERELTLRRLLAELIEIQTTSRYSKLNIAIKGDTRAMLPDAGQFAMFSDDGKAKSTLVLRGGAGLSENSLRAEIFVEPNSTSQTKCTKANCAGKLVPVSLAVNGDGAEIVVTLPSLSQLGLELSKKCLQGAPVRVYIAGNDTCGKPMDGCAELTMPTCKAFRSISYAALIAAPTKEVEASPNLISSSSALVIADSLGNGRVQIVIGELPDKLKAVKEITLIIKGADAREDKTLGTPRMTAKGSVVAPSSTIPLVLGNLSPANLVEIEALSGTTSLGKLKLLVERRDLVPAQK